MCTDLFCWNVRGFNKFSHRNGFKKWIRKNKPLFGGIIETRVKQPKIGKLVASVLPGWSYADNYSFLELGKIWILWHSSVKVVVLAKSLQQITCEVHLPDLPEPLIVTIIYAANSSSLRAVLWTEIELLAVSPLIEGKPWSVLGDFNQTLSPQEHSAPRSLNIDKHMRLLSQCLIHSDLEDLHFRGEVFTWWNKRKTSPIAKKLDRILVNDLWYESFSDSLAHFDNPDFSDHACSTISLKPNLLRKKKPFKFYNFLLQNPDFVPTMTEMWYSFNVRGSAMFILSEKLRLLKKFIRDFSKANYSELEKRVSEAHARLLLRQAATLHDPSPSNAVLELDAQLKWQDLAAAEASFLLQRSRILWLGNGDAPTSYYHRMVNARKAINHIHFLTDDNGVRYENHSEIENHCVDYFSNIMGSDIDQRMFQQDDLNLLFDFRCSPEDRLSFTVEFSTQEIKDVFFSLPRNKTSGPDGYSAEFFTACWQVIGPEVTAAVREFFRSGQMLRQWNATTLILIPKVNNASSATEFRPISCLNTVYKVISKLISIRLKAVLPRVISQAQSAFMPSRLLAENVLLATDLVKGYSNSNSEPKAMLKVDLKKAFDSVRWDFIIGILRALSIPETFINWIYQSISTATFSVSINGASAGFFNSTRGIRQGDPMSPYLFVLTMEGLSRLLYSRYESGSIGYHPRTSEVKISHLMFADDVMVFFDGKADSLHGITECLSDFASWSGLSMNISKTELYHSGLTVAETNDISAYGFTAGSLPVRYLGLPLMSRKLRIAEYEPLINKLLARFRSWSVKALSFAGRLQLIATVIYGTVNFWMSVFILPKGCIKRIESLCSRFLWSGNTDTSGKAKIAWTTVCLPKAEGETRHSKFNNVEQSALPQISLAALFGQ